MDLWGWDSLSPVTLGLNRSLLRDGERNDGDCFDCCNFLADFRGDTTMRALKSSEVTSSGGVWSLGLARPLAE